ncbi:uncharacterized protein LOC120779675 isoform X2 [Bactrocera tryoni]|uniref:uncharacterized protein LOC120779675 isoform X2 n=1 Tax=Bactrocera tryoni TaxID=59916 RepID=UPI001A97162E|nr:uncharacterized protein LOC120779675 isoform X2 [Bactrocera tryoni]
MQKKLEISLIGGPTLLSSWAILFQKATASSLGHLFYCKNLYKNSDKIQNLRFRVNSVNATPQISNLRSKLIDFTSTMDSVESGGARVAQVSVRNFCFEYLIVNSWHWMKNI